MSMPPTVRRIVEADFGPYKVKLDGVQDESTYRLGREYFEKRLTDSTSQLLQLPNGRKVLW